MTTASDAFLTISSPSQATYSVKMSKFLSFAHPITTVEEGDKIVKYYQQKYYDARHCCYAYMIGAERTLFRANDNGEPSGTAGKPILGQINSHNLTNILIVVVRYFGGIKLGTSGLIQAYKTAASEVLANAQIVERTLQEEITISFEYSFMNAVMRIVKEEQATMVSRNFEQDCRMTLRIRKLYFPRLKFRLEQVRGLRME